MNTTCTNYRLLFESTPGLFLVLGPDAPRCGIVAVSDAHSRSTLTRREDIPGKGLFEVFPPNADEPTTGATRSLAASLARIKNSRQSDVMAVENHDVRHPAEELRARIGDLIKPLAMLIPERFRGAHARHVGDLATDPVKARRIGARREIVGLRRDGTEFPAETAISRLDVEGVRLFTATLRDVTEQRRIEREQRFLAEVGEMLTDTMDLDELLGAIGGLGTRVPADWCLIDLLEPDGTTRIVNAIKYTPRGGIITLGAATSPDGVRCWVTDNGIGIAPGHLPHLFDRFWQAAQSERLGLGLAIASGSLEAHSGTSTVDGTLGRGTTFTFTVPRTAMHEVRPAPVDITVRPAPPGKRLLVVEEDARSCRVLAALLRTADYTAETAMSGVEALSRLSTYYPDLVLVDISMPGMSGLEFMARARSVRADLRFVAVTGHEPDSDLLRGASIEAHVGKPIEFTALLGTLAVLLGRASPASTTAWRTNPERAPGALVTGP